MCVTAKASSYTTIYSTRKRGYRTRKRVDGNLSDNGTFLDLHQAVKALQLQLGKLESEFEAYITQQDATELEAIRDDLIAGTKADVLEHLGGRWVFQNIADDDNVYTCVLRCLP